MKKNCKYLDFIRTKVVNQMCFIQCNFKEIILYIKIFSCFTFSVEKNNFKSLSIHFIKIHTISKSIHQCRENMVFFYSY